MGGSNSGSKAVTHQPLPLPSPQPGPPAPSEAPGPKCLLHGTHSCPCKDGPTWGSPRLHAPWLTPTELRGSLCHGVELLVVHAPTWPLGLTLFLHVVGVHWLLFCRFVRDAHLYLFICLFVFSCNAFLCFGPQSGAGLQG